MNIEKLLKNFRVGTARFAKAKTHDNALHIQKANRSITAWRKENLRLVVNNT